jgi:hypothetical protein
VIDQIDPLLFRQWIEENSVEGLGIVKGDLQSLGFCCIHICSIARLAPAYQNFPESPQSIIASQGTTCTVTSANTGPGIRKPREANDRLPKAIAIGAVGI